MLCLHSAEAAAAAAKLAAKKASRKRPKLTAEALQLPQGIPYLVTQLPAEFRKVSKGKGHEVRPNP